MIFFVINVNTLPTYPYRSLAIWWKYLQILCWHISKLWLDQLLYVFGQTEERLKDNHQCSNQHCLEHFNPDLSYLFYFFPYQILPIPKLSSQDNLREHFSVIQHYILCDLTLKNCNSLTKLVKEGNRNLNCKVNLIGQICSWLLINIGYKQLCLKRRSP